MHHNGLNLSHVSPKRIASMLAKRPLSLFAEVIETSRKPSPVPTMSIAPELGMLNLVRNYDLRARTILAVGQQDTDASGLMFPPGTAFIGAISDHTVVDSAKAAVPVGYEMKMSMNYNSVIRAMSTPDVAKVVHGKQKMNRSAKDREAHPFLTLV